MIIITVPETSMLYNESLFSEFYFDTMDTATLFVVGCQEAVGRQLEWLVTEVVVETKKDVEEKMNRVYNYLNAKWN